MKKTLTILLILVLSAVIAVTWVKVDEYFTEKNYPLEHAETVQKYAKEYSVPESLIYAVIKCESDFKSDAVSSRGAIGLMQIMPATYAWLCQKNGDPNTSPDYLYNPEVNIKYGVYYLDWLYSRYMSWETAVAAYNAGHGRVDGWLEDPNYSNGTELKSIPFAETRNYVQKVFDAKEVYEKTYFEK